MSAKFKSYSFNAADYLTREPDDIPPGLRGVLSIDESTVESATALEYLASDEATARRYAEELLISETDDDLEAVVVPGDTSVVPGLALERIEELPAVGARSMHFEQKSKGISIFDTNVVVEIDAGTRHLNSIDAQLANVPDVSPVASISAAAALEQVSAYCGTALNIDDIQAPDLCFFAPEEGADWYLTYHFSKVPAAPEDVKASLTDAHDHGHGMYPSPREEFFSFDFLVDAHSGGIVYYFSAQPFIDVPVRCTGVDEFGTSQDFFGRTKGSGFEMVDPLRNIETYDHSLNDITGVTPANPIDHSATNFAAQNTAGVSAHYHASLVFDFFNHVLKRNGIDGKGMRLVSLVNCTYSRHGNPPIWRNAVWWKKRMWYGQTPKSGGAGFDSYARYLDVIAHELTHGVTETTSNLVYRDESGALNESFSDIFGVMVANWYPGEPNPLNNWNWEIGAGLGTGALPLRDMSDPTRTGDPDHWNKRQHIGTVTDFGGVHFNSGIHNKAAYNLFTSVDSNGAFLLSPTDVGLMYYLTLTRLSRRATFKDCLRVLKSVAATYFIGDVAKSTAVRSAIDTAYSSVGIV